MGVGFSEFTVDNTAGDSIELYGDDGTDLTGYTISLYDSSGTLYNTINIGGTITGEGGTFNTGAIIVYEPFGSGTDDSQLALEGTLALRDSGGNVIDAVIYETTLTAGSPTPPAGITPTDAGTVGANRTFTLTENGWENSGLGDPDGVLTADDLLNEPAPCFLEGTHILLADGKTKAVEEINIGDKLLTADGASQTVKWLGYRTVAPLFADAKSHNPICIQQGAFGDNIPSKDLYVSPDHAMFIDNVLVQASALVNDSTITQINKMTENFTYYHIELDTHDLIISEGAVSESFVDADVRERFDNSDEFHNLYPDADISQPMALPRIKAKRQLPMTLKEKISTIKIA